MKVSSLESKIDQVKNLFKEQEVNRFAKESRLIQRSTGKLNPVVFLIVMIVEMSILGTHSLRAMCELFTQYGGMSMTPQALSLRLNRTATVSFFKKALSLVLNSKLSNTADDPLQKGILNRFRNIYLEDSTTCTLHEHVADSFKGSGADGCKAGYKVHTLWNAIKMCLENFYVTPSSITDQSQSFEILKYLKKEDLILRDLGYFALPCFKKIHELGAYFLSRLKVGIKVYTFEGFLIEDIVKYIDKNMPSDSAVFEMNVLLGVQEKLSARLIVCRVPEKIYNQRMRKLRRTCQKTGRTCKEATANFYRYTFFITNIPKEKLASKEMATLYKLRWEIEILFKCFKSKLNIDIIKGKSKTRVECFIISRLISVLATSILYSYVSYEAAFLGKGELSFFKFSDWILVHRYLKILFSYEMLKYEVLYMKNIDIMSLCKQKLSRETTRELLEREAPYDDIYPSFSAGPPLKSVA